MAKDVELDIYLATYFEVVEVGVFEGEGDDAYLEAVAGGVAHGKANTIHCDLTFVDGTIASLDSFVAYFVFEGVDVASFCVFDVCAGGCGIDMALDDMTI